MEHLEPRADAEAKKFFTGSEFFRCACRVTKPLNPETVSLAQLIGVLFGDERAAVGISLACNDNLMNLKNQNWQTLRGLTGVGPGIAGRLIALFELIRRADESEFIELKFDPLALLKREAQAGSD